MLDRFGEREVGCVLGALGFRCVCRIFPWLRSGFSGGDNGRWFAELEWRSPIPIACAAAADRSGAMAGMPPAPPVDDTARRNPALQKPQQKGLIDSLSTQSADTCGRPSSFSSSATSLRTRRSCASCLLIAAMILSLPAHRDLSQWRISPSREPNV